MKVISCLLYTSTKRGKAGEAKFTYDGMFAVQRQTKRLDMMLSLIHI